MNSGMSLTAYPGFDQHHEVLKCIRQLAKADTAQRQAASSSPIMNPAHPVCVCGVQYHKLLLGAEPARFRRSVAQLHANMLGGFGDWCAAVDLPERVPEVEHGALSRATGAPVRRGPLVKTVPSLASGSGSGSKSGCHDQGKTQDQGRARARASNTACRTSRASSPPRSRSITSPCT